MPKLNKLLANLPFNPSLIGQISFYSKRLKREASIRRLGFIMLFLAMLVQLFAFMAPPQPSLAKSDNDLIYGGFTDQGQAVLHCLNGQNEDFNVILNYYGIGCSDLDYGHASVVTINAHDYDDQLYSMGRFPYGIAGEQPVSIPGANGGNPLYIRFLWGWGNANYQALSMFIHGQQFFVLFDCGNLVSVGVPTRPPAPAPTPPALTLQKDPIPGYPANESTVAPGQQLGYRLSYGDSGGSTAVSVILEDGIPDNTSFVSASQGAADTLNAPKTEPGNVHWGSKPFVQWIFNQLAVGQIGAEDMYVKVNDDAPDGARICNMAYTAALNNTNFVGSETICYTVKRNKTPPPTPPKTPPPTPKKPCEAAQSSENLQACIVPHKTAKNMSRGGTDANDKTAHAGDVIEYTLTDQNIGRVKVPHYVTRESVSDILDYADITDFHGGSMDKYKIVTWPAVDIKRGETVTHQLTVKIKDPIPNTPASSSDPAHFDHRMTNVYGDTVIINLPGSVVSVTQRVNGQLVNTGPGTSLIAIVSLTVVVGYFFARSRLISEEVDLVRSDYASTGGL
jgi:uncharacterized repeat protein (TIGR01451 family)